MKYTSTNTIPIWNYSYLKKIVVKISEITNPVSNIDINKCQFTLFDKSRANINPVLTTLTSFNLHNELLNFEKLIAAGTLSNHNPTLYGQRYIDMYYIRNNGNNITTFYTVGMDKTFNIIYTYDASLSYDFSKKGTLPLQFIFKNYSFKPEDIQKYKTMGYTAEEMIKAGIKFSQLLTGGYNIINELFPVLCKLYSDIPTQFTDSINNLKNTVNSVIITENIALKTNNENLTTEIVELKKTNIRLTEGYNDTFTKMTIANEKNIETVVANLKSSYSQTVENLTSKISVLNTNNENLKLDYSANMQNLTSENNELKNTVVTLRNAISNIETKNNIAKLVQDLENLTRPYVALHTQIEILKSDYHSNLERLTAGYIVNRTDDNNNPLLGPSGLNGSTGPSGT